ncbi:hypothetical protein A2Z33_04635 [Candidatus Gottesmanbacteria bacterium RBG_16_52_11]|uniref:Bacterial Ig-like domain-containing protein n=1 Tax=Candidatus Gottesmanbacteria bacterium RBG_16_52_11 TaxID=1798374 RepID=A0A1F5YU55_9BACT|nr:MAG: hypothetical protein A2Z33_04635 [Candidatus Gottesmanbacteria bacterium RBG_16_52_11]
MYQTRIGRSQERKARQRLYLTLIGSLAAVILLGLFGLKILVSLSVAYDWLRGSENQEAPQEVVLPPTLYPVSEATNSSYLKLTGKAAAGQKVIVYINGLLGDEVSADDAGLFTFDRLRINEGSNEISAKAKDSLGNLSGSSNLLTVNYRKKEPKLELVSPADNASFFGDLVNIDVTGTTDPENSVTVNGRVAVVRQDGSFRLSLRLSDGPNTVSVTATDIAGNTVNIERIVSYVR